MTGEMDVRLMLSTLTVSRRPEIYTMVSLADAGIAIGDGVEALISEAEGTTAVMTQHAAERLGASGDFEACWLTLDVHSSLEAVGLTAAVAEALADDDIPCNVLAGFHHDHLLVPVDKADRALECLAELRARNSPS